MISLIAKLHIIVNNSLNYTGNLNISKNYTLAKNNEQDFIKSDTMVAVVSEIVLCKYLRPMEIGINSYDKTIKLV